MTTAVRRENFFGIGRARAVFQSGNILLLRIGTNELALLGEHILNAISGIASEPEIVLFQAFEGYFTLNLTSGIAHRTESTDEGETCVGRFSGN